MQNLISMLVLQGLIVKEKARAVLTNERGEANLIAIILVLAIVIALAIIFRGAIKDLFDSIWGTFEGDVNQAVNNY